MATSQAIRVDGLAEFSRSLRKLDSDLPKALRMALNEAADTIVQESRKRVPKRSGRAANTIRAQSTRTMARVVGGGRRARYYPWLDFGGRVGKHKSVRRPFYKEGRYIYKAFHDHRGDFADVLHKALLDVASQAGVAID